MKALFFLVSCIVANQVYAVTLKIATISPEGTNWMTELHNGAAEIDKRTAGRVKMRFYPGGVMGNDNSVLRKIRIHQLQGGALTGGGLQTIYPDSQVYSVPFMFRNLDEVDYVRTRMDKLILDGLHQRGFVSFGLGEGGFAYLMSSEPIHTVEDLKDRKVWVPQGDRISRTFFEAAGVSPVPLQLPDVLTGLQTGLIDTVGISPIGAIALQWHTRVKYVTDLPLMYLYGILVIDRRAFERARPQDRAVVREVMEAVFRRLNKSDRIENEHARQALIEQGIKFIHSDQSDPQYWNSLETTALKKIVQNEILSQEILDQLQANLDEYRKTHVPKP